jgi:hypothetical protein
MYGPSLHIKIATREEVDGVPLQRYDFPLVDGSKNVLLVLRVAANISSESLDEASEWLQSVCKKMEGTASKFYGVTLYDNDAFILDVIEVDDEVTKP